MSELEMEEQPRVHVVCVAGSDCPTEGWMSQIFTRSLLRVLRGVVR